MFGKVWYMFGANLNKLLTNLNKLKKITKYFSDLIYLVIIFKTLFFW
jgi:hypothetical protein